MTPFADEKVAKVFDAYPDELKTALLRLRQLIFETAAETEGVGALRETLKWGQPSYLTEQSKSGTTIRIDAIKDMPGGYGLFVHCQTSLLTTYRELYGDELQFQGNRCVEFDAEQPLPEDAARHCIALALTYHQRKTGKGRTS